jgi:hypothetical protein
MKKLVMTAAVLTCAASIVSAQTVTSANVVGYYKSLKPAGDLQLLGVSFGTTASTLDDLLGQSQFTGDPEFQNADQVITWNAGTQTYKIYGLYDGNAWGDPTVEWRDVEDFYTSAASPVLPVGSAAWLSSPTAPSDVDLIASGEVPLADSVTNSIVAGLNMLAYPFSADFALDNSGFAASGATGDPEFQNADQIIAWDVATQTYKIYGLYDGNAWGDPTVEWRDVEDFYTAAQNVTLDLGRGFWYQAASAFTWVEATPYPGL